MAWLRQACSLSGPLCKTKDFRSGRPAHTFLDSHHCSASLGQTPAGGSRLFLEGPKEEVPARGLGGPPELVWEGGTFPTQVVHQACRSGRFHLGLGWGIGGAKGWGWGRDRLYFHNALVGHSDGKSSLGEFWMGGGGPWPGKLPEEDWPRHFWGQGCFVSI